MASHRRSFARGAGAVLGLCAFVTVAWADDSWCPGLGPAMAAPPGLGQREVFVSNYTHHWSGSSEHLQVHAMVLRQRLERNRFCGFSLFSNSFGQPSAYVFVGKIWPSPFPAMPRWFASLSAGMLYGYVRPYANKVPLNVGGFSPAVVPALGYQFTPRVALETHWLGTAALMVGVNWRY